MGLDTTEKNMTLEIHKGSPGYYVHCLGGRIERDVVSPPASFWFQKRPDAEVEALRLATATGKAYGVVRLVSKCVPWHCFQSGDA